MTDALKAKLRTLPAAPGVYFHKNAAGEIIYIGKAAVLKNRVRQYFQNPSKKDAKTRALVSEIAMTDWTVVDTEMDALFLESEMVKRYKPKWNILLRDDKSCAYVRIDMKSSVPYVSITRNPEDDGAGYFGPYYGKSIVGTALRILRPIFPFYTKPYNGKKTLDTDLGLTPGIETGQATPQQYKQNLRHLISYIKGNRQKLIRDLEKKMRTSANKGDYEAAAKFRNQFFGLRGLATKIVFSDKEFLDISSDQALRGLQKLLKLPAPPKRIDGFDISHQSGTNVVASQVTFINGVADRTKYRRFKLRTQQNNDFANMREIITRRLNHLKDWGTPDLILIDGGEPQLRAVADILDPTGIPYIGLAKELEMIIIPRGSTGSNSLQPFPGTCPPAKSTTYIPDGADSRNPERSPRFLEPADQCMTLSAEAGVPGKDCNEFNPVRLPKNSHIIKLLQRIRDESHRFAVQYHTLLKRKSMLR
jgi:excinuclease ABC subunit C